MCNNSATPKSLFITWLALWNRLPTKDRPMTWKVITDDQCPLCSKSSESVSYLFFEREYATGFWQKILHSLQFSRRPLTFEQELTWILKATKRTGDRHKILLMYFAECIYGVWIQRNGVQSELQESC